MGESKEENFLLLLSRHQAGLLYVNIASSLQALGMKDQLWSECVCRFKNEKSNLYYELVVHVHLQPFLTW